MNAENSIEIFHGRAFPFYTLRIRTDSINILDLSYETVR